jgi:hypothetical protein
MVQLVRSFFPYDPCLFHYFQLFRSDSFFLFIRLVFLLLERLFPFFFLLNEEIAIIVHTTAHRVF